MMRAASLRAGAQVEISGAPYALLRKVDDETWQLEDPRSKRIREYSEAELWRHYGDGTLRFTSGTSGDPNTQTMQDGLPYRAISDAAWEAAKLKLQYVRAVIDIPSTQTLVAIVVKQLWNKLNAPESPPHPATVLRWKAKYLAADKDVHALIERTDSKGNRTPRYPEQVKQLAQQALELTYLRRERKTLQDAVDKAAMLVQRENQLLPAAHQLPAPSRRLLKRLVDAMPAHERRVARHGTTAAAVAARATLGHPLPVAPLERAEIDHTQLDLFVIDDDTGLPLGRPWVTACMDIYSRCVLGIYLGFQPPGYLTVAACLKNAFLPKPDLQQKFPDIRHSWRAHGIMKELVVDNGLEFHSKSLEHVCLSLGIELHYSPRRTPWFKGHIERFFRSLNDGVAHGNPGTTFSSILEKGDYDPAKHAVVRLSTLHPMVRKWIVDYYHQRPHHALAKRSPDEVWQSCMRAEDIFVPENPTMLEAIMGRCDRRVLSHKGIQIHNLVYNSPELKHLRARVGETFDVEVRIDESDLGHIIVIAPNNDRMFKVAALNPEYAAGLSLWQHRLCQRYAAERLPKPAGVPAWIQAKDAISQLVEREFKWAKQRSRSKVARYQEHSRGLGAPPVTESVLTLDAAPERLPDGPPLLLPPLELESANTAEAPKAFSSRQRDRSRPRNA